MKQLGGRTNTFPGWIYLLLFFIAIILAVALSIFLVRIFLFFLSILLTVAIALYLVGPICGIEMKILEDLRELLKNAKRK